MGLSCFIHLHGNTAEATSLGAAAERELQQLKRKLGPSMAVLLHTPLAVAGADPLPVAQDARLMLCQLYCPDDGALTSASETIAAAFSGLASAKGVHDVHAHVMSTEWLRSGSPEDARAPGEAVSFFVQYDGPAENPAAFHAYYRSHHVPIVFRMPGIRSVTYYLPTKTPPPPVGRAVDRLQVVQAVFDSADDFVKMRQSAERKEGLRDFDNYPKFEGPVTHQVMRSRRFD
ncbi:MAG: EthD domain-containing protein [Xanthobacteraceae bacterium]|nr:EthD domain-containing protein [Xanthobacteraceae bacterium]